MPNEPEYRAVTLRLPPDLFERVRASAAEHDRSAGAEVRVMVREALAHEAKSAVTQDRGAA